MAYKQDGLPHFLKFFKFMITFCLKKHIPHRQSLIYNQDFRLNIDGNSKSKPYKHTA